MSMTGKIEHVAVVTSVQRRRRWSAEEKAAIVQETYAPGMSVSLVARRHGIAPNQLFTWRRLYASGALSAVGAGEGARNSRFFGCTRSSASRRISFSNVFLPKSRCSSRT